MTVVLTDAPAEIAESSQQDPNRLVVHQQDIQAVVNAMWKAGATAVTIQGQRVVSTTGIKCIGNSRAAPGRAVLPALHDLRHRRPGRARRGDRR